MRRFRRILGRLVLGAALLVGGLAALSTAGCDVAEDEFYDKHTQVAPGRQQNPYRRYAFAYVGLLLLGTFFMWTVCKSSRRSVVKAGEEH